MRPQLSEETVERLVFYTEGEFSVPADRVTIEDRVRVVLDKLEDYEQQSSGASVTFGNRDA